jgi:hypothetical protein
VPDLAAEIGHPTHEGRHRDPQYQNTPAVPPRYAGVSPKSNEPEECDETDQARADRCDECHLFMVLHQGLGVVGELLDQLLGGLAGELHDDSGGRDQHEQREGRSRELAAPP